MGLGSSDDPEVNIQKRLLTMTDSEVPAHFTE